MLFSGQTALAADLSAGNQVTASQQAADQTTGNQIVTDPNTSDSTASGTDSPAAGGTVSSDTTPSSGNISETTDSGSEDSSAAGQNTSGTAATDVGTKTTTENSDLTDSSKQDPNAAADIALPAEDADAGLSAEAVTEEAATFSVTDADGNVIKAVLSYDGNTYLYLTRDMDASALTISYTGDVQSVNQGALDQTARTITANLADSGAVMVTMSDGSSITLKAAQSSLPSLCVTLNGTTLDQIQQDKNIKYSGNKITLDDGASTLTDSSVEIKGRGNTSWDYFEKKPYQISLSKKASVLGMGAAKKWILLANSSDASLEENAIAFDLAKNLGMPGTPDWAYTDLWIDGVYQGNYLICEKIEINKERLNLSSANAVISEHDDVFYSQETNYFSHFDLDCDFHFTLKDNQSGDDTDTTGFNIFQSRMEAFLDALDNGEDYSTLSSYVDMDSFARYYLVNEYTLNAETVCTSNFYYMDGENDVIHAGPVWDFDTTMASQAMSSGAYYLSQNNPMYIRLTSYSEFRNLVIQIYYQNYDALAAMEPEVRSLTEQIRSSADMNYTRWNYLGKGVKDVAFAETYQENVDNLCTWLHNRLNYFTLDFSKQTSVYCSYDGIDYGRVFDSAYYLDRYPDIKAVYGNDANGAFSHFITYGMNEGRQASVNFDPLSYKRRYQDLRSAFGGDWQSYYNHYVNYGWNEGRLATGTVTKAEFDPITVYNGIDYAPVYDYDTYLNNYGDLSVNFSDFDDIGALRHFILYGMFEGRQAIGSFNVDSYAREYADLRHTFVNNLPSYYNHYIKYGVKESRNGTGCVTFHDTYTAKDGIDYADVYDGDYYLRNNNDVYNTYKYDDSGILNHFITYGMGEGRRAKESFDVNSYAKKYTDLRHEYGNDLAGYYLHYIRYGKKENRQTTGCDAIEGGLTTSGGKDYSAVYSYGYYVSHYRDLWVAFHYDEQGALNHFLTYGMSEGRQASPDFNVILYKKRYEDLRNAFGDELKDYYLHYINYGLKENRDAI